MSLEHATHRWSMLNNVMEGTLKMLANQAVPTQQTPVSTLTFEHCLLRLPVYGPPCPDTNIRAYAFAWAFAWSSLKNAQHLSSSTTNLRAKS